MSFSFDDARQLDSLCYDLVLGDFPRGENRARILKLANGAPPYSDEEVEQNNIEVNVNDLTHTRLCHDARTQFYNGFLGSGNFVKYTIDAGPKHKRTEWGAVRTRAVNRVMKRSIAYYERLRAEFGMLVLHGISPGVWENKDKWCPRAQGIEDVLIPSDTLLGFENLPFIVLRRTFTGMELQKITRASKRDKGWNMPVVQSCLDWLGGEMQQLRATNWPEVWSPEKVQDRIKQDGGYFMGDQAPRLDMFDIYGYVDNGEESGWVRRIILDSWNDPTRAGQAVQMTRDTKGPFDGKTKKNGFVFSSGNDFVARSWQEIISCQFADLSAQFPAKYHGIRSLGWLTYSSCHIGNRMRCKFYESVFEALMQYFKVKNADDVANALRLNLINRGFIDDTIKPVPAAERWEVNAQLVELGLNDNAGVTSRNSSSFVPQPGGQDRTEKTRYQVMAEMQQMSQLVSASLNQAYMYQRFELDEIGRRFGKNNSRDPEVREAQAEMLRGGIPEKYVHDPRAWEAESERVMGAGNKTLEMTIAQQLMEWRDKYDPEAQRDILRDATLAITGDPRRATLLVPDKAASVTPSTHDAELTAAALMNGISVEVVPGANHIEATETLLKVLATKVQAGMQQGGMVDPKELKGLFAIAAQIGGHVQIIAQDKDEKQRVKRYGDLLGKLVNQLKAFQQRLEEAMKKQAQQNGNGQGDPKDAAKLQAMKMQAQVKAQNAKESHAQKTAQRQIQFEQQMQQDQQRHQAEIQKMDLEAAGNIRRSRMTGLEE